MRTEFAAFGPWIYEVTTPDEVPPLYRDHPLDLGASRYVIKVPRNIDRRDANPSMDLYDHLLVAGADELTVMSRQSAGHSTVTVPYREVAAIEHSTSLLDGRLTLHSTTGRPHATIRYNGTSKEIVDRLIEVVRGQYLPARDGARPMAGDVRDQPALGELDEEAALVGEAHSLLRAGPGTAVLAAHPRRVVRPRDTSGLTGGFNRLAHALWRMTLQSAIVCSDRRELQLVHRRQWWVRGALPVHSVARTVVPTERIDRVSVRDHEVYAGVRVVSLHLGETVLDIPVPEDSAAGSALTRLAR